MESHLILSNNRGLFLAFLMNRCFKSSFALGLCNKISNKTTVKREDLPWTTLDAKYHPKQPHFQLHKFFEVITETLDENFVYFKKVYYRILKCGIKFLKREY